MSAPDSPSAEAVPVVPSTFALKGEALKSFLSLQNRTHNLVVVLIAGLSTMSAGLAWKNVHDAEMYENKIRSLKIEHTRELSNREREIGGLFIERVIHMHLASQEKKNEPQDVGEKVE